MKIYSPNIHNIYNMNILTLLYILQHEFIWKILNFVSKLTIFLQHDSMYPMDDTTTMIY